MRNKIAAGLLAIAAVVGVSFLPATASAGPIQGDDGYSLDEYRFEYGMDGNITGDTGHDIAHEMNLRQNGMWGNNN